MHWQGMIQVFPDEFHIATLEQELAAYTKASQSRDADLCMHTCTKGTSMHTYLYKGYKSINPGCLQADLMVGEAAAPALSGKTVHICF